MDTGGMTQAAVARVHPGLLYVLHHRGHEGVVAVGDGVGLGIRWRFPGTCR